MKLQKALKLAIQALHEAQKPLHFDANMLDLQGVNYPLSASASRQRQNLRDAATTLLQMLNIVYPRDMDSTRRGSLLIGTTLEPDTPSGDDLVVTNMPLPPSGIPKWVTHQEVPHEPT